MQRQAVNGVEYGERAQLVNCADDRRHSRQNGDDIDKLSTLHAPHSQACPWDE